METNALDEKLLATAVAELAARDPQLAAIAGRHGPPPLWARPPGFASLVKIVFEQSVSLKAAQAIWRRLEGAVEEVTPAALLALGPEDLRAVGLSRAKTVCCLGVAEEARAGRLDLDALAGRPDDEVRGELLRLRGIGPWTVDVYLLFALLRPDAWPAGDLALAKAAAVAKGLQAVPKPKQLEALAEPWRPWRGVAARLLWWEYLGGEDPDG
jgi:DNA-3-methyladenine glycosylase II